MSPGGADVVHVLEGAAVALAVALPGRRLAGLRRFARGQSAVVGVAAAWAAWAEGSATLAVLALIVWIGGVVLLPWALARESGEMPAARAHATFAMAGAAAMVVLALLAVIPAHLPGIAALREDLAWALAAVLVALPVLATRQGAAQAAGLWALANGVALASIQVASPPTVAAVGALFGLVAVCVAARPAAAP
jgi:hydrogenase-4 membrane subunit HyfE